MKYSNSKEHQGTWKPFVFYFHECRPWQPDWTAPVLSVIRRPQLGTHITSSARRVCSWPVSNSRRSITEKGTGFAELATITTAASSFCKSLQGRGSSLFSQQLLSNKVLVCEIISNTILPDSPFIHVVRWYFFKNTFQTRSPCADFRQCMVKGIHTFYQLEPNRRGQHASKK